MFNKPTYSFRVRYHVVFHSASLWTYSQMLGLPEKLATAISSWSISNEVKELKNLDNRTAPVDAADDEFWEQFWSDSVNSVQVNRELIYTEHQSYKN
jgi:hypothetical protein